MAPSVVLRDLSDVVGEYLKRGSQAHSDGSLRTRRWQDKQGKDRYTTEIRAERLRLPSSRTEHQAGIPRAKDPCEGRLAFPIRSETLRLVTTIRIRFKLGLDSTARMRAE